MIRWTSAAIIAIALTFGFVPPAEGDTVVLKSGVRIDGEILFQDENTVRIRIGERERTYPAANVIRIDENEKTGRFDPQAVIVRAEKRAAEMLRETGLTAAQRREVKDLMASLQSTDKDTHEDAKRALLKFHINAPLHKYFAWWLPSLSPRFVPGVLEILGEINPDRAAQIARAHITDLDPRSRAMALTVLGANAAPDLIKLLARGMVDPELEVRIAAARALGKAGAKEATPLLIESIGTQNPYLTNVANDALRVIWSTEFEHIEFESQTEWQDFWKEHQLEVESPLMRVAMTPLTKPGQVYEDE